MKRLISIIAPMYNEEALVVPFLEETLKALASIVDHYDIEVVMIDDGSTDDTLEQMKELRRVYPDTVTLVELSRNFGLEGAIYAGVRASSGDAIVVMDADLQDPPSVILRMIKEWENGADIVVGSRTGRPTDSIFKRRSAGLFYKVLNTLSGRLSLEESAANFRLLNRKAKEKLLALPEVNGVFRVSVPFIGMKTSVVCYARDQRYAGDTKYRFKAMVRYALDSITAISIEPLRKIPLAAAASFALTIIFALATLTASSEWRPSMLICATMSLLFSMLFVALSIMAEYLGQTFIESKGRPTAIVYDFKPSQSALRRAKSDTVQ